MLALRIHRHGGTEALSLDDIAEPVPGPGEVKVRACATSLNHMDLWVRKGMPGIGPLPLTLGCDLSGIVDAVGSGVTAFKPKDRVLLYPLSGCGTCAACMSGDTNLCRDFKIPGEHVNGTHAAFSVHRAERLIKLDDRIDFATAAAFPLTFLTAWHMLVANGNIAPGMDVLIMAAGSGVGAAGVQIAKHCGARVIATAGGAGKLAAAKELGADAVIDHYAESISKRVKELTNKRGVAIVFEHVGAKVWDECLKSLAWGGRLVTCGATSGPVVSLDLRHIFIKQQRIIGSTMGTQKELEVIHGLVAQGRLKTKIAATFTPLKIREAHEFLETSKNFGKVIINWE